MTILLSRFYERPKTCSIKQLIKLWCELMGMQKKLQVQVVGLYVAETKY